MSQTDHSMMATPEKRPSLWERMLAGWAGRIRHGRLRLVMADGREQHFGGQFAGPSASLTLNTDRAARRLFFGGTLSFSEAYIDGDWDTPDISSLLELALANEAQLGRVTRPMAAWRWPARLRHLFRRNSRKGSRRNIAFHYDLGNAFYAAWLDQTMTYSAALFTRGDLTLDQAQLAKYDRIIDALEIGPEDHVLEIGCGWGGFAERAVKRTGCRVTGITLSKEQADFARRRLERAGLSEKAEIRLEDYRDVAGRFSKAVSIEMFEAVGEENWPAYFDRVAALLTQDGKALVQVITIAQDRFDIYRRGADFIQTHIFPGGMLPSVAIFEALARQSELAVIDRLHFGRDYERTLLNWDQRFTAGWRRLEDMGFDERFQRMWRFYLHYSAAGFRTGRLDVVQFTLGRSDSLSPDAASGG